MLLSAVASDVFTSCDDGDTCRTTRGESLRLAWIMTPVSGGKAPNKFLLQRAGII
ncbi:hypothetical protein KR52_09010 [Synechococcus sp. KORDI-52]|uniref:hypothetical protein n=1 Tax=Synechococcus sp. KORDI-52 TaxID=585425 RepID=UPI0004E094E6|nr:hypothetical protein [Synechococcus sp. KORDI-52]AII49282.1 hypothetical protein KR52_09010 [Synechococcus sp. KORDI-52]